MTRYTDHFNLRQTPQTEPIPGRESEMVKGRAGGMLFKLDHWGRLDRFLILGAPTNTYYATRHVLTIENAQVVVDLLKQGEGVKVVERITEISVSGRAPKQDPALFALAICFGMGDLDTRRKVVEVFDSIARIGTWLFQFAENAKAFRGTGKLWRAMASGWYNDKDPSRLAYQMAKYRQRHGWSHRDVLRLAHPEPRTDIHNALFHWATQGWDDVGPHPPEEEALKLIWALEKAQRSEDEKEIRGLILDYGLTREMVPNQFLSKSALVWDALLQDMPVTATIRNLANMTRVGLLGQMSDATKIVCERVTNADVLRKGRVHPIQVLAALLTYASGEGARGSNTWDPVQKVVDALDEAFYMSFDNVLPTGKRIVLAVDTSGSMSSLWSGSVAGVPGLSPQKAAAAMAMMIARTENEYAVLGFDHRLRGIPVSPRQRLDDVIKNLPADGGGTDASLPIKYATEQGWNVDAFILLTDNETWAGQQHPVQALDQFRRKTANADAKLISVGMTADQFSVADPKDPLQMDIVGFDTAAPSLISDFVRG